MEIEELNENIKAVFMIIGLIFILPPVFLIKLIKFLKE